VQFVGFKTAIALLFIKGIPERMQPVLVQFLGTILREMVVGVFPGSLRGPVMAWLTAGVAASRPSEEV
jgi:hypothetical protein